MAKSKKGAAAAAASGRGSPEAVQKRRVARRLNDLLSGKSAAGAAARDGRTEKRRQRLLAELDKGTKKGGKGLKPIDLLRRVHDLLELGEPVSSIRKVARVRPTQAFEGQDAVAVLREVHAAYGFRPEAYGFLGLPRETLVEARLLDATAPRRGRPPKNPRG